MRPVRLPLATLAAAGLVLALTTAAADARCTRLAFSVNDYGKDGPTKDAKNLLDKYIAKWTTENGIKKYTTGKKDVTCELFLDFGVFDEYTCKASAAVCWEGSGGPKTEQAAKDGADVAREPVKRKAAAAAGDAVPKKAESEGGAKKAAPKAVETGSIPAPAPAKKE